MTREDEFLAAKMQSSSSGSDMSSGEDGPARKKRSEASEYSFYSMYFSNPLLDNKQPSFKLPQKTQQDSTTTGKPHDHFDDEFDSLFDEQITKEPQTAESQTEVDDQPGESQQQPPNQVEVDGENLHTQKGPTIIEEGPTEEGPTIEGPTMETPEIIVEDEKPSKIEWLNEVRTNRMPKILSFADELRSLVEKLEPLIEENIDENQSSEDLSITSGARDIWRTISSKLAFLKPLIESEEPTVFTHQKRRLSSSPEPTIPETKKVKRQSRKRAPASPVSDQEVKRSKQEPPLRQQSAPAQSMPSESSRSAFYCKYHGEVERTKDYAKNAEDRLPCSMCDFEVDEFRQLARQRQFVIIDVTYSEEAKTWSSNCLCSLGHRMHITLAQCRKRPLCPFCHPPSVPASPNVDPLKEHLRAAQRRRFEQSRRELPPRHKRPPVEVPRFRNIAERRGQGHPHAFKDTDVDGRDTIARLIEFKDVKSVSPWDILCVTGTRRGALPSASDVSEAKARYRKWVMRVHPDKNPDPRAKEAFHVLNSAWKEIEVLMRT